MVRRLPRLTRRVFTDLALLMATVGVLTGAAFVLLAPLVGVPARVAHRPEFVVACLGAGLLVAGVDVALARLVVGTRVAALAGGMAAVRADLFGAGGDGEPGEPPDRPLGGDALPVDSTDELGAAASAFNDLRDAVVRLNRLEGAVSAVGAAMAGHLAPGPLAGAALQAVTTWTGSSGGMVVGTRTGGTPTVLAASDVPERSAVEVLTTARAMCQDPDALPVLPDHLGLTVTPLRVGSELVGLLALALPGPPEASERLLAVVGQSVAAALASAQLHDRVRRLAAVDELTGVTNRRAGLERLDALLLAPAPGDLFVGVLLVDVDRFRRVNDVYGHAVGDEVLRHVAATVAGELRACDTLCRYGGEELLALLPGAGQHTLQRVGERVRAAVAAYTVAHPTGDVRVTVSVGGAAVCPPGTGPDTLLAAADTALHTAKVRGGDAVRIGPAPSLHDAVPKGRRAWAAGGLGPTVPAPAVAAGSLPGPAR